MRAAITSRHVPRPTATHTRHSTQQTRKKTKTKQKKRGGEYGERSDTTYADGKHQRSLERAPQRQRAAEHDGAPRARARRRDGVAALTVVQALAPGEQREEAEELRLHDQRHVEVLRDHVDAQRERGDAPEESARWGRI